MAEGYLYKRGKNWYLKFNVEGKWRYKSLKTTNETVAEKKREQILKRIKKAQRSDALTVKKLEELYAGWAARHLRPRSIEIRLWALNHLKAHCPIKHIELIRPADIEQMKQSFIDTGKMGNRTINDVLDHLRTIINEAIRQEWYDGPNPFLNTKVRRLPRFKKLPQWLNKEQIETVLEKAAAHSRNAHFFFALGIYAGMRKLEIDNARWEWFDFDTGLIYIRSSPHFELKDKEERVLPLHDKLRDILKPHREQSGFLIAPGKSHGKYRYRFDIRKAYSAVIKDAGVEWCNPHVLRHTFASQLVSNGVELYKVSQWLGHADFRTTQIYAHLKPRDEDINRF